MARKKRAKKDQVKVTIQTLYVPKPTEFLGPRDAAAYLQGRTGGAVSLEFLNKSRLGRTATAGPAFTRLSGRVLYARPHLDEWLDEHREDLQTPLWRWRQERKRRMARLSTA